ncbi:MAG: hypothetical protein ABUL48_00150 [Pseudorhodoplanes sp.]
MGIVISFPAMARTARNEDRVGSDQPATVVILPVVRVERRPDEPSDGLEVGTRAAAGRKRRRRASRS